MHFVQGQTAEAMRVNHSQRISYVQSTQEMAWSPINHSMLLNSVEINLAGSRWNEMSSHENMFSMKLAKSAV